MRVFLSLTGACAAGVLVFATAGLASQSVTQMLNPPPPSYYTCNTVGSGTICTGQPPVQSYGPIDTALEGSALFCGNGSGCLRHLRQRGQQQPGAPHLRR